MAGARLIYEQSVEGLYLKGHRARLTPQVKAAIKAAGIDLDAPLKSAYPAELVNHATTLFRALAYAQEPDDAKAYTALGAATMDGYFDTVMGRAMAGVLKLIGFKRVIARLPQALASGSSYLEVTVTWPAEHQAEVTVSDTDPSPHITLGVLQRAFTHWFAAPGFTIALASYEKPKAVYRLSWSA